MSQDAWTDDRRSHALPGRRASDWGAWGRGPKGLPGPEAPPPVIPKVLVVDDAAEARQARRNALAVFQAEIFEAASGAAALAAVREHDFALILLDSELLDVSGFELTSLLRAEKRAAAVPVMLILPATASAEQIRTGYRMGAVDCVVDAPLDTEVLRQKARVFFDINEKRAELTAARERAETARREMETKNHELLQQQDILRSQATHDLLTGLPNRALLEDRLDGALKRATRSRQQIALALVNLDGFRTINEQHGFGAGDELLVTVGKRLMRTIRASDTVSRLGGDEFAVVLEGLHSAGAADYLAHKMASAIAQPCILLAAAEGTPVDMLPRASIGICVFPDHGKDREELVGMADMAMRQAKKSGGGVRLYGEGEAGMPPLNVAAAQKA